MHLASDSPVPQNATLEIHQNEKSLTKMIATLMVRSQSLSQTLISASLALQS
jgi:hypothetical protein